MAEFPPKWALDGYAKLWVKFKDKSFKSSEANKVISNIKNPSNLYSLLKKDGWLKMERDQKDSRKSIYQLRDPKELVEEIGKYES